MSWDQSRGIPWSRIRQDGVDPDVHKEQVFRDLRREAQEAAEVEQDKNQRHVADTFDSQSKSSNKITFSGTPFSGTELAKQAAFGGCIGSITGAVFGFMDGMRTAGESPLLRNASNAAKGKYLLQGTTRSATIFGGFFGGFHMIKYGLRVAGEPGAIAEIGIAGAVSMGLLMVKPATRPSMPYAAMLVFMDAVSIFMKEFDK